MAHLPGMLADICMHATSNRQPYSYCGSNAAQSHQCHLLQISAKTTSNMRHCLLQTAHP
jgi:hypothetical protein